jgi:polar amino acid transport system substrate-binding protein
MLALAPFQLAADCAGQAPSCLTDPNTGAPEGEDIQMGNAICKVLGVVCNWNNVIFDDIIAQITGTTPDEIANGDKPRYVFAVASMSPRAKREAAGVDFISYFESGNDWFALAGGAPITTLADQCGKTVAVQTGTIQESDDWTFMGKDISGTAIPGATDGCKAAGKPDINIITFASATAQVAAVLSSRADYGYSSTIFNGYLVSTSKDKLKLTGPICGIGFHGITIVKNSPLEPAITAAVKYLIDNGYYLPILKQWGMADDAITSSQVLLNDNSTTGPSCT